MTLGSLSGLARAFGGYVFAAAAGLVSAWAVHQHLQQRAAELEAESRMPTVPRLVAAEDLPAGTRLRLEQLALRDIPEPWLPSSSLAPEQVEEAEGAVLDTFLRAGEPVLRHQLRLSEAVRPVAEQLAAGRRAISLPLSEIRDLPPHVQPGDRVDLYVSFPHEGRQVTVPVLQAGRVLAVGGDQDAGTAPAITLETSRADAMKVIAARQSGELTALLQARNAPEDGAAQGDGRPRDLAGLLGWRREGPKGPRPVRIIYGDRLDGGSEFPTESTLEAYP